MKQMATMCGNTMGLRRTAFVRTIACSCATVVMSCSSDADGVAVTGSLDAGVSTTWQTPEPSSGAPPCVISADCPAGQFCDLGECIQECNTQQVCGDGFLCSPRGRCLKSQSEPTDPVPVPQYAGAITAEPASVALTERDRMFRITLKATSTDRVRYRVQLNAPHLTIDQPRGEFTGSTTLTVLVNADRLKGHDVAGSVKVFSTLGTVTVEAPIHVGLTGSYQGAFRYDGGNVPLGDARVVLEVIENKGDVSARVDGTASLLFPSTGGNSATGTGTFSTSDGLKLSLSQRFDRDFGGDRNHFKRAIGRRLHVRMQPTSRGDLEGEFEETVYGLFAQPVRLRGHIGLEYRPQDRDPQFTPMTEPEMPDGAAVQELSPADVFGWTENPSCWATICGGRPDLCMGPSAMADAIKGAEAQYYQPLADSMANMGGDDPYGSLAESCEASLSVQSFNEYRSSPKAQMCGTSVPLACGLEVLTGGSTADVNGAVMFGRLMRETLAAPLLVAKEHAVKGLYRSFVDGTGAELASYDRAVQVLGPAATWVLQPVVLEHMRSMSLQGARGGGEADGNPQPGEASYPSARALADLLHTLSVIDGERARVSGASRALDAAILTQQVQERAVIGLLEAASLASILETWGQAPEAIVATFTGLLTPLDQGFAALSQGASAFGVPDGFVPFVFNSAEIVRGSTNFEQMHALAGTEILMEKQLEGAFKENKRTYEVNAQQLRDQLNQVKTQFDLQIKNTCGSDFDPDAVVGSGNWSTCGKDGSGQVGELTMQIDEAVARLNSAQSRIQGMEQKIQIDQEALARTQKVHEETLQFLDETGKSLQAIILAQGVISAEEAIIQTASQANLWNAGVPAAAAPMQGMLALEKAVLDSEKQGLQTAQTMRFEQAGAEIELINGMAAIQRETIDLAQLGVDMVQDVIGVTLAKLRVRNAVAQAREIFDQRMRTLALLTQGINPLNDPSYRLLRDRQALQLLDLRAAAQRQLLLVGRALEYEINQPIDTLAGSVLAANNDLNIEQAHGCMMSIFNGYRSAFGVPQDYVTTISVRALLGIKDTRQDVITGERLDAGMQFRQLLLRNENLDGQRGVGIEFATDLQPNNDLWSTDVCTDRITGIQAQIVGDYLGDNQSQVNVTLQGGGLLRACGSGEIRTWTFGSSSDLRHVTTAVVQAGVNSFGDSSPNTSLFGLPVAGSTWRVTIPGPAAAPSNADIDLTRVEDIALRIHHKALPLRSSALTVDASCLGKIGG